MADSGAAVVIMPTSKNSTDPAYTAPERIGASHHGKPLLVTSTPRPSPSANMPNHTGPVR